MVNRALDARLLLRWQFFTETGRSRQREVILIYRRAWSFNPLALPLLWQRPWRLTPASAWHGHIPWAFAVTALARPRTFVELGTHMGDSYFAFCQAVEELRLATRCFAVDTWRGDQFAGLYGEHVHLEVSWYNQARHAAFSTLVRSTFDEAWDRFPDGSIDLLHIDGAHDYESASHDFYHWLPKMSGQGIVLLHDTAERGTDFGVWRLWEELAERYPAFHFPHAHGLGVAAVGNRVPPDLEGLFAADDLETRQVRLFFAFLGDCVDKLPVLPQCSIVVPQYGRADLTIRCLDALLTHVVPYHPCEVIVVDASPDDAAGQVGQRYGKRLTLIRSAGNLAFAGACNKGAAVASGRYIVFLNNGTLSSGDWLAPMLRAAAADPKVGLVGARLLYPDNTVQHAGIRFAANGPVPLTPFHNHLGSADINDPAVNTPGEVPAVTGACMLVDRSLFMAVGGFDEAYDGSGEDIDLCLKVRVSGRSIWYEPRATLVYFERRARDPAAAEKDARSLLLFNKKWLQSDWLKYVLPASGSGQGALALTFVLVGRNNLPGLHRSVRDVFPYLVLEDKLVLCDAGSNDGTAELMANIARNNPGRAWYFSGVPADTPDDLLRFLTAEDPGFVPERLVFWEPVAHDPGPTRAVLDKLRTQAERTEGFQLV